MCENTLFVTGRGQHHRIIELKPIVETLGPEKIAALPAFHALSGADNTGSFSGKGKLLCWKIFAEADSSVITTLAELGQAAHPNEEIVAAIEKFVCLPYQPRRKLMTVKEPRLNLFKKKQAQSDKLPPTQAALQQAILRARYQLMVWNRDRITNPELPSPQDYGWHMDQEEWGPVMTKLPSAPEAILQLVQCGCFEERCSTNLCQCRKAGLNYTDLCKCSDNGETCDNDVQEEDALYSDEVEDSSDSEMYIHE